MVSRWKQTGLPEWDELMWVTLESFRDMPMPVTVDAVADAVSDRLELTSEQRAVPSHDPRWNYIRFQLGFAVSDLKGIGTLDQPRRGLYNLTDAGREVSKSVVAERHILRGQEIREQKRMRKEREHLVVSEGDMAETAETDLLDDPPITWQQELLDGLKNMSPAAFEHLAAALLRVAGFDDVEVTGRSGDGGIDGIGVYRPSGLISFRTAFQCKRYQGSVGGAAVREFRGSFAGRSDRGIILTTGSFTSSALAEAARDGVGPIDLIDGETLCDLLREFKLGVTVTERVVEDVAIDDAYFERLER